jgi:SAM-dependent methyltransferase
MTVDSLQQPGELKAKVKSYWELEPCGTRGLPVENRREFFEQLERERYQLEPYIPSFAQFDSAQGKRVLEIGVGAGTDFIQWVRAGAQATGIDLTDQGISLVRERLQLEGLSAELRVADAEHLPFDSETFDVVYSYGVIHHTPNTIKAVQEIHRVLKAGGVARVMIYHLHSWVAWMIWTAHCAVRLQPWRSPRWAIFHYLESPGTKAFTTGEARRMFASFSQMKITTQLSHGDLLNVRPSAKYRSRLYDALRAGYPRRLVKLLGNRFGLMMLIESVK